VHIALDGVELVVMPVGESAVGVPEGYDEMNWPPMTVEGKAPTEVTNFAAL
jgi:hypothetical protein